MNRYLPWIAAGAGFLALVAAVSNGTKGLKPVARFEVQQGVIADNQTGEMYAWIDFDKGRRFVKLNKNMENNMRDKLKADEYKAPTRTVRARNTLSKTETIKRGDNVITVKADLKFRGREGQMLYKIAMDMAPAIDPNTNKPGKCVSNAQVAALKSIYSTPNSSLKLRLEDKDGYWLNDVTIPLFAKTSNNAAAKPSRGRNIIDGVLDSCGRDSGLVFHGVAKVNPDDFYLVNDGKMILKSVKVVAPTPKPAKPAPAKKEA